MTRQKSFKAGVRSRMAKTGERYTAARRQLIERTSRAEGSPATEARDNVPEMLTSDEAIRDGTGRGWDEWFAILDAWGATEHSHPEIARWLVEEQGLAGWWAQSITVGYERARGMRAKHQTASGFSISVNRTVAVSAERLSDAFTDAALRQRWLPGTELTERTSRRARSARFDWPGDGSVVVVGFTAKGADKTQVGLVHEKLPDSQAAERMKAFWRERLGVLKGLLEDRS
jgi:hypothetical protein